MPTPPGTTLRSRLLALLAGLALLALAQGALASPSRFSDMELADGFMRTVFGLEYGSWGFNANQVKKYTRTVRIYVHSKSRRNRARSARQAIRLLNRQIRGLNLVNAKSASTANFHLYIVDRRHYKNTVRERVFKNRAAHVPGRCLVHVEASRSGIRRSAAVIVADEGEFLFRRCLYEEILQGLGPMNDDSRLVHSVFNDRSRHAGFTPFDRYILNMLYDRRIRPGMNRKEARQVLPAVIRDVRRRLR